MNTKSLIAAALLTLGSTVASKAEYYPEENILGSVGLMLGGGYLEEADTGYLFGQLRGTFYSDQNFSHTAFIEILGHGDDVLVPFDIGGSIVTESADLTFINVTANYELEAKLGGPFSVYAGAGAGFEFISLDDRFDVSIDVDANFVAQAFLGLRVNFDSGLYGQIGARYLTRDDFEILGGTFLTDDSWSFEAGFGFRF